MFKEHERQTRLEDIDISDIYPPPDRGIENLVKAIRSLGYTTWGSCGGHLLDQSCHPFPWVTVAGLASESSSVYEKIRSILDRYNKKNDVRWTIEWAAIHPEKPASTPQELTILQASANSLTNLIFNECNKHNR